MCIKLLSCKMSHVTQHYFKMMAFDTKWYVFTPDDHEKKKLLSASPVTQLISKWQVLTPNEHGRMRICHFKSRDSTHFKMTSFDTKWCILLSLNDHERATTMSENLSFQVTWVTWLIIPLYTSDEFKLEMTRSLSFIFIWSGLSPLNNSGISRHLLYQNLSF